MEAKALTFLQGRCWALNFSFTLGTDQTQSVFVSLDGKKGSLIALLMS